MFIKEMSNTIGLAFSRFGNTYSRFQDRFMKNQLAVSGKGVMSVILCAAVLFNLIKETEQ